MRSPASVETAPSASTPDNIKDTDYDPRPGLGHAVALITPTDGELVLDRLESAFTSPFASYKFITGERHGQPH
jgi:hypothetical protein